MVAKNKKALSKPPKTSLAKQSAALEKTKHEVLDKGYKHVKPLSLARRRVLRLTAWILGLVLVIFLGVISFLIYNRHDDSGLVYGAARIIPFPVARVNGSLVSYADYLFEVRYRRNIYENPSGPAAAGQEPIDFESPSNQDLLREIQQSSLERAKVKTLIKQLAAENDVSVSQSELETAVAGLIERQGGEDKFLTAIENFYGWDMGDFRQEYHLQLLEQELQLKVLPEISKDQRVRTEQVLERAKKGEDFAALAREFSEDEGSKEAGGDLGLVGPDTQFVEEFKSEALKLEKDQVSDIVITQFGFHIIKATDKTGNEVKVSHILIKFGQDMESLLADRLAQAKVNNFIKLPAPANPSPQPQTP